MAAAVKRLLSPEEWKKRQIDTLKSVGEANYKVGIASPKRDPIEAGIAAQDRYEAQMKKDEVLKRREEALKKTSMAEWYKYASELGAARLVDGVTKREAKVGDFVRAFQPLLLDHVNKIDALPDVTDSDRENRMVENLRGLKALKGKA
ncbi:MAG: hypothetical protein JRE40_01680 [Deltaproteobacteria bacterium]|nr:hypothetical protein [Deltaproteobacteria bacterium]MBW2672519.1 hypothetical protein [Deltaproteobacteria bacterium]